MGFYSEKFLPRFTDVTLGRPVEKLRARVASGLSGEVLEVGFGSGRNVPHYPAAVVDVAAVDPAMYGRVLAAGRVAASRVPVRYVGLDGQELPLADESIDSVLVTWTLCSIPDIDRALSEMRRVLRPGGAIHFIEHGRSPNPGIAKWQDRLTPLWGRIMGGCHLNRPIPELLSGSGFALTRLETSAALGPELVGYTFEGVATKP